MTTKTAYPVRALLAAHAELPVEHEADVVPVRNAVPVLDPPEGHTRLRIRSRGTGGGPHAEPVTVAAEVDCGIPPWVDRAPPIPVPAGQTVSVRTLRIIQHQEALLPTLQTPGEPPVAQAVLPQEDGGDPEDRMPQPSVDPPVIEPPPKRPQPTRRHPLDPNLSEELANPADHPRKRRPPSKRAVFISKVAASVLFVAGQAFYLMPALRSWFAAGDGRPRQVLIASGVSLLFVALAFSGKVTFRVSAGSVAAISAIAAVLLVGVRWLPGVPLLTGVLVNPPSILQMTCALLLFGASLLIVTGDGWLRWAPAGLVAAAAFAIPFASSGVLSFERGPDGGRDVIITSSLPAPSLTPARDGVHAGVSTYGKAPAKDLRMAVTMTEAYTLAVPADWEARPRPPGGAQHAFASPDSAVLLRVMHNARERGESFDDYASRLTSGFRTQFPKARQLTIVPSGPTTGKRVVLLNDDRRCELYFAESPGSRSLLVAEGPKQTFAPHAETVLDIFSRFELR